MGGLIGMFLASYPNTPIHKLLVNDVGPRIPAAGLKRIADYVGRMVTFASIEDMARLFDGIPLADVTTSMTINAPAVYLLACYIVNAERQGVKPSQLRGTLQNDMLKEYIAQKEWISPIRPAIRIMRDMLVYCTKEMPLWNTISISGYHIREAGATAVQELAFTLADGIGYVQMGIDAGLDVDSFAPRLSYFFDVHNDFFEEIAKFRAARRIWAKVMRERFHAKSALVDSAYACPDCRRVLDGAAAAQQRGADDDSGARSGAGWHAESAHQFL
jgi:methylmalonyl-CoA mutase cobalamin-binding domain/chain